MKNALTAFKLSYQLIFKDKISLLMAIIPIIIGIILYSLVGTYFFSGMTEYGLKLMEGYITDETLGKVVGWILTAVVSVLLYFIVNWTFVLVVSVIASPFNDVLSSRIEKQMLGEELPGFSEAFSGSFSNFFGTIFNELKKVTFILGLSVFAFAIGLIPLLAPLSIFIGALAIASEFLDFSWARHDWTLKEARSNLKKFVFSYGMGGSFFMLLIALPLVGLVVPSWGTSYFTVLWIKNNEHSRKITQQS